MELELTFEMRKIEPELEKEIKQFNPLILLKKYKKLSREIELSVDFDGYDEEEMWIEQARNKVATRETTRHILKKYDLVIDHYYIKGLKRKAVSSPTTKVYPNHDSIAMGYIVRLRNKRGNEWYSTHRRLYKISRSGDKFEISLTYDDSEPISFATMMLPDELIPQKMEILRYGLD